LLEAMGIGVILNVALRQCFGMKKVEILGAGVGDVKVMLIGVAMSTATADLGVSGSGVLDRELSDVWRSPIVMRFMELLLGWCV
jgi:hypothetical protein